MDTIPPEILSTIIYYLDAPAFQAFALSSPNSAILCRVMQTRMKKVLARPLTTPYTNHLLTDAVLHKNLLPNGDLHGPFVVYKNNIKVEERTYDTGLEEGISISRFPNGTLHKKAQFHHGQYDGLYQQWHENGKMYTEVHYEKGMQTLHKAWYENGQLKLEIHYDKGREMLNKLWYENGNLRRVVHYIYTNKSRQRIAQEWDEKGQLYHDDTKNNSSIPSK